MTNEEKIAWANRHSEQLARAGDTLAKALAELKGELSESENETVRNHNKQ